MKKLLTILVALAATLTLTTSCEDNKKSQKLDPNAMISLRPDTKQAANVATKANPEHLSAIEIVKQTANMWLYVKSIQPEPGSRGFSDAQRDTVAPRLMMWGTDVITSEGTLLETFITGEDVVLVRGLDNPVRLDTIAYIQNSALRDAEKRIRAAFAAEDYTTCYSIFDQAFRFSAITGPEWRELKAQGLN